MDRWYEVLPGPVGDGYFIQLDVGRDGGVYAVDNQGGLHFRVGITATETTDPESMPEKVGTGWEVVSAGESAVNVAHCANGYVYFVDQSGNNQLVHNENVDDSNDFRGTSWTTMSTPGTPRTVTCGAQGKMLFLSTTGEVYYRNGVSYANPSGTDFVQVTIPRSATNMVVDLSVGESGDAFILFADGFIQYIDQTSDNVDMSGDLGTGYTFVDVGASQLVQLDAGNTEVWGVNRWNEIFVKRNVDHVNNPLGDDWAQHQGEMIYVSTAEQGIVWAIDDDHDVWVLRAGTITTGIIINNEPTWEKIPDMKLVYLDVGKGGQLVGLLNTGCSFWRKGITNEVP